METDAHPATTGPSTTPKTRKSTHQQVKPLTSPQQDHHAKSGLKDKFVPEWIEDNCLNTTEANFANCLYGDPSAEKTAVLLGDSVSISWMPGLRESLGQQGWKIQVLTMGQCPAIGVSVTRPNETEGFTEKCQDHQAWAVEKVSSLQPDMVIVTSALSTTSRIVGADKNPDVLGDWTKATVAKLKEMQSISKAEVVLLSAAMQGENLIECATKVSQPSACNGTNANYLPMLKAEEAAAAQVPDVRFISTRPWFCADTGRCPAFAGTTPVFVDGSHITPAYSAKLAPVIGSALLGEKG